VLGAALVFIVPAFQITIYVLVFGNLLKGRLPGNPSIYGYSIYLCTGILFWNYFMELLQRSQNLFLENANLLKKAAFPRSALSIINFFSTSINLGLALLVFLTFLIITDAFPGLAIFGLVASWFSLTAMALAFGLCIAILQVFFRDFGTLTAIALQSLFWGTPIVYPSEILPSWLLPWMNLNPMSAPIGTAQALLLNTQLPAQESWISTILSTLLAGLFALRLYRKYQSDLMDNL
jgi:lipopolysaccharide transport system permease protein